MQHDDHVWVTLPSGRAFSPSRPRSAGVLNAEEFQWCRSHGVALTFDPAQQGWITAEARDDLAGLISPYARSGASDSAFVFRPWAEADRAVFRALLDDPAIWRYLPQRYPAPLTDDIAGELIAMSNLDHHEVRAVEWKGAVIGQVRLDYSGQRAGQTAAEISYWLGRAYWGRGLGQRMVSEAATRAFREHADLARLFAWVHPDNAASARVLVNAGFARVETKRADGWVHYVRSRA